jgi:WD40 repeat protein/serine/threonine protein kinase
MDAEFKDQSGEILKGYELRQLIGRGGFGAVYRAYQPVVERDVAIKIILPEYANHPNFVRRFESEAQYIARLEHIHIVPLYDYWREPNTACLVMRWLKGGSLQDSIDNKGAWSIEATAQLLDQLASALAVAHRAGIIHRDLKPANVLLDEENNAYLADFGIAKNLVLEPEVSEEDRFGSPAYISPEQVMGQPVSPQTDIYSLGVVIYMMLTGRTPFLDPSTTTVIRRHLSEPLPPLQSTRPDLPHGLNLVIWRATSKRPEERYPDTLALAADFRRIISPDTTPHIFSSATTAPTAPKARLSAIGQTLPVDLPLEPENPYKGLRAFQEADAHDFFGRKELINRIAKRLEENEPESRFLAVVGPSGSGKSSAVRAGLIPSLRRNMVLNSGDWYFASMMPGATPFSELESALLKVAAQSQESLLTELKTDKKGLVNVVSRLLPEEDGDLFLLIDQFEEVFTLATDEAERTHFLNSLLTAATDPNSRIRIVITLRADFYDRPLLYPEFGELVRKRTEIILPLTSAEMEQAIVGPADRIGLRFEPGVVAAIVSDVNQQPGSLPLLQFALTELFERRNGYSLTQAAYNASGGVLGALARRADEIFDEFDPVRQDIARQIFLRLVSLGEGTEDTKRRILQSEIVSSKSSDRQTIQDVIDTFLKHRLLTADFEPQTRAPTLEVAHEALIRVWQKLKSWLDASRDDLRLHQKLSVATTEWIHTNRDSSYLASGARLSQFEQLQSATTLPLAVEESNYLEASMASRQRATNRLRLFIAGLVIFSIVAFSLALIALDRQRAAETEKTRADVQASISRARELAVTALTGVDQTDLGLLLSLESLAAADTFEGRNSLLSVLQAQPYIYRYFQGNGEAVRAVTANPDGIMLVSGGIDNAVTRWDTTTGKMIGQPLTGHTGGIYSIAISPDGKIIASASADESVRLWDTDTGQPIGDPLLGHTDAVWSIAFSPDGKKLASAGADMRIILWDIDSRQPIGEPLTGHEDIVYSLAFNLDGTLLASGSGDSTIRLWDTATGDAVGEPLIAPNWVLSLAFSPSTGLLASTGADSRVTFWDTLTGDVLTALESGHQRFVRSLTFSSDGQYFATAGQDGTVRVWDALSGDEIGQPFSGHTSAVWSAAFLPDSNMVASAGADGKIIVWNLDSRQSLASPLFAHGDSVLSVAFSPDGKYIASGGGNLSNNAADNTVRLWDVETGEVEQTHSGHERYISDVAFSPDGHTIASASADQTIHLWNFDTGNVQILNVPHRSDWIAIAFSPDGKLLASSSVDLVDRDVLQGEISIWDIATGELVGTPLVGHTSDIFSVAFSPDGLSLASASNDRTVIVWDLATRQPRYNTLVGHRDSVVSVVFSPDGQSLASASHDGTIILWNTQTGQPVGQPLVGHTDWVTGIAFSPDGTMLASSSYDSTMALWSVAQAERIGPALRGHSGQVNTVAFSPDGKHVASGGQDGLILLWDADIETWKSHACSVANRNLSTTEWDRYFQGIPYHETCAL